MDPSADRQSKQMMLPYAFWGRRVDQIMSVSSIGVSSLSGVALDSAVENRPSGEISSVTSSGSSTSPLPDFQRVYRGLDVSVVLDFSGQV